MNTQRLLTRFIAGLAPLVMFVSLGVPAQAVTAEPEDNSLSYSSDGKNYDNTLPTLFVDAPKLIPGEELHRRMWIRNERSEPIEISVHTKNPESEHGIWMAASPQGKLSLGVGASRAVDLRVWLPVSAGNSTQNITSQNLRIQVQAHEQHSPDDGPDEHISKGQDQLGDTGFFPGFLSVAIGALITGIVLNLLSRRKKHTNRSTEGESQ